MTKWLATRDATEEQTALCRVREGVAQRQENRCEIRRKNEDAFFFLNAAYLSKRRYLAPFMCIPYNASNNRIDVTGNGSELIFIAGFFHHSLQITSQISSNAPSSTKNGERFSFSLYLGRIIHRCSF